MKKIKVPDLLKAYKKLNLKKATKKTRHYLGTFKERVLKIAKKTGNINRSLKARGAKMQRTAFVAVGIISLTAIGAFAYYLGIINTIVKEEAPQVKVTVDQEPEVKLTPSAIPEIPDVIGTPSYPEKGQKEAKSSTNQSQSPGTNADKNPNTAESNMAADNKTGVSLIVPAEGRVIREFGFNYSTRYKDYRFHDGIDIEVPQGAPALAAAAGKVAKVAYREIEGYEITIEHGSYLQTHYKHLTEVFVAQGDTVTQGQEIGRIAEAGSYLHFGITHKGNKKDPQKYLQ